MIASLFGTIRTLKNDQLVIEVNGVGYLVFINGKTASKIGVGGDFQIFTSMVVREDSMTLYGFIDATERELFELVQTVSGIGPKVAMAITAAMSIEDLASAVAAKDESAIAAIPGIGKKGAQRMILELDGKLDLHFTINFKSSVAWRDQVIEALTGLGFSRRQSEEAINEVAAARNAAELSSMSTTELLKIALSHTGSQKGLGK